jgi:hypothetical protein
MSGRRRYRVSFHSPTHMPFDLSTKEKEKYGTGFEREIKF